MKTLPRRPFLAALAAAALAPFVPVAGATAGADPGSDETRTVEIAVEGRYTPSRITVREGERLRLRFVRRDYGPCTREVLFPSLGIRRSLPTNEPVLVDLPALAPGEHAFRCGMNMIHGTIVVVPSRGEP